MSEKITTQFLHKMIEEGEKELSYYQKGSKKWLLIYSQIEVLREMLAN